MNAHSLLSVGLSACALVLILILNQPSPASAQAPAFSASAADPKKELIGTWKGQMLNDDGSPQGAIQLEITADTITATNPRGGQLMGGGTYKISSSTAKRRRIDATGTSGQFQRKKYEGIYAIEGKTLRWCSANDRPTSKRPTELKTDVQKGQFLMVLEKQ
jgi:uncharacterized protein (TIGR03067 family)